MNTNIPSIKPKKGFLPINYSFTLAGIALRAKANLYRFDTPEDATDTFGMRLPISDAERWLDRFSLSSFALELPNKETINMPEAVITVSLQKQIKKTAINGLEGSIKEYFSNGDYSLQIETGIVALNDDGYIIDKYPSEGVSRLKKFLDHNGSLNVSSPLLNLFDISQLVVTGYTLQCAADSNHQIVSITAVSDKDYVIRQEEY